MHYRTHRILFSHWRRFARWEFWPSWAIYPPVVIYVLILAVRHRSLTLFTLANPGMPEGGFALESKSEILGKFGEDCDSIARWSLIGRALDRDEKTAKLDALFLGAECYPVVLKPDIGERGLGVLIARDRSEAIAYLTDCPQDVIVQEFVGGEEFGVFYARHTDAKVGEIISTTVKQQLAVIGDGETNLETLILRDDRAVCHAKLLLKRHAEQLDTIPLKGDRVVLAELGTHSRGATFLDGSELLTEALTKQIDAISKRFEGFYFGRFDVKAPDREALRRGEGISVIELNGVTSEPTHIYDPKHGVLHAWRTLCSTWQRAFEIGAANRKRGMRPVGVMGFVRLLKNYRARERWEAQ